MGVGDRHSKRVAAGNAKASSSTPRTYTAKNRELDDAFSAWDDDDAGARPPEEPPRSAAVMVSSMAHTRVERRGAAGVAPPRKRALTPPPVLADGSTPRPTPLGSAHVDPAAMRDITISRVLTLDDPLTTGLLAEVAREEAARDRGDARAKAASAKAASAKAASAKAASAPDNAAPESQEPRSRPTRDDIALSRRSTKQRSVARDEPFRKK